MNDGRCDLTCGSAEVNAAAAAGITETGVRND
jgi:hypothetical protein